MEPTYKKVAYVLVCVALGIGSVWLLLLARNSFKAYDYIGRSAEQKHSMFVSGEGKVTIVPDIARIDLGITTRAAAVADAQKENTEKINQINRVLKDEFKIDAKDIKTTNYSIYPEYNWQSGRQELIGYTVSQTMSIKVRDLESISAIVGRAGAAGLNQIGGLTFDVDNPEDAQQEARLQAIAKAKEKAESTAQASGIKLGRILSISESGTGIDPYPYFKSDVAGLGGGGAAPVIDSGTNDIKISVTIEYEVL